MSVDYSNEDLQILGITFLMGSVTSKEGKTTRVETEEEELALLKKFHSDFQLNWPLVISRDRTNFDAYSEMGVPMFVIVDQEGKIRRITTGHDPMMETETSLINRLLEED